MAPFQSVTETLIGNKSLRQIHTNFAIKDEITVKSYGDGVYSDDRTYQGYFVSFYQPMTTIIAFVMLHLAFSMITLESTMEGLTYWIISNLFPLVIALTWGSDLWWSMFCTNQIFYMFIGLFVEYQVFGNADVNHVFDNAFFDTLQWNDTANAASKIDLLQNAETVSIFGFGAFLFPAATSILAYFALKKLGTSE